MDKAEQFQKLIQGREDKLYRIAFSYMNNKDDALDCVQDAMVKGIENLHRLKQKEYFDTWLIRILINTCKDSLRKRKMQHTYPESPEQFYTEELQEEVMDLLDALEKLSDEERELIHLRYFENRKIIEISKMTQTKEGSVKSRLHRVLLKLREDLK